MTTEIVQNADTTDEGESLPVIGTAVYGWCTTADHDTEKGRGGCPVQTGSLAACACPCHDGATAPRPLLPTTLSRSARWGAASEED